MKQDKPNNEEEKHKYEISGFAELVSKRYNLSEMQAYPETEPKVTNAWSLLDPVEQMKKLQLTH